MESRPVHSIFTPKEVITDVTTQGVTSVTNRVEINSLFYREYCVICILHNINFNTDIAKNVILIYIEFTLSIANSFYSNLRLYNYSRHQK